MRVSFSDIRRDVARLGLGDARVVVLHGSLSSIGWVDGGADAVIDAFLDAMDSRATLMVPTFTRCFAPRSFGRSIGNESGSFGRMETRSTVGRITETLRKRPEARRSFHPIHSAAALGPDADELTRDHPRTTDFGPLSPFGKLLRLDGLIFLLGVGQNSNSSIHAIEDELHLPYLAQKEAMLRTPDGGRRTVDLAKCPVGCRDFYSGSGSKFDLFIRSTSLVRHGGVGGAEVQVMPTIAFAAAARDAVLEQPDILLCDRAACRFCAWARNQLRKRGFVRSEDRRSLSVSWGFGT